MASVLIRNVDETLHARLKARAAAHDRSLEKEALELLRTGLARQEAPARENLAALAVSLFGPRNGADLDIPPRGTAPKRIAPDFRGPEYRGTAKEVTLLDTNVISELIRAEPAPAVLASVGRLAPEAVFTAAICEAEIRYGLARMPRGRKRDDFVDRISRFFDIGFQEQILPFDRHCAIVYGEVRCSREAAGKPIAVEGAMIAATAKANGALAMRNVREFADCGVPLIDPWTSS